MKKCIILLLAIPLLASSIGAQSSLPGLTLPSNSGAVTDNAISVLSNPAWLAARSGAEAFLMFPYINSTSSEDLGLLLKLGSLGFAGEFVHNDVEFYNRYTLGKGFKLGEGFYAGISHTWWRVVDWDASWNLGLGFRPLPFFSAGAAVFDLNQPNRINPTAVGKRWNPLTASRWRFVPSIITAGRCPGICYSPRTKPTIMGMSWIPASAWKLCRSMGLD